MERVNLPPCSCGSSLFVYSDPYYRDIEVMHGVRVLASLTVEEVSKYLYISSDTLAYLVLIKTSAALKDRGCSHTWRPDAALI